MILSRKYKVFETQIARKRQSMKIKIPEIKKAIEIINFIEKKQKIKDESQLEIDFMITDTIYSKAKVKKDV